MRTRKMWTDEEDNILLKEYGDKGPTKLAEQLGRTYLSVFNRGKILGLHCSKSAILYTKEQLQIAVANSASYSEVLRFLGRKVAGGNLRLLKKSIEEHDIDVSPLLSWKKDTRHTKPISECLVQNSRMSSSSLKRKLYKDGLKKEECEKCGQGPIWNGERLVLQLDHVNGDSSDNRIENINILCPNCHTQTRTHSMGLSKLRKMKNRTSMP